MVPLVAGLILSLFPNDWYIINLCFCLPQTFYILPVEKVSTLPWLLFCSQLLGVSKFDALPATKIH